MIRQGPNLKERSLVMEEREDNTIYKVVMNHEEQYSIWPADRENPLGWKDAGKSGPKDECLAYIKEVWTDMRPLSLRKKMESGAGACCRCPRARCTSTSPIQRCWPTRSASSGTWACASPTSWTSTTASTSTSTGRSTW